MILILAPRLYPSPDPNPNPNPNPKPNPSPNQVRLDTGCDVLVHRDEHWLVRDLALQREGVRIGADGTRCLGEFSTNLNKS